MKNEKSFITSESVTEGHPDKLADQISDGVLDAILKEDPMGRVACECMVATGLVMVAGQITTECYVDIPNLARKIVKEIGYTRAKYGFDGDTCAVLTAIDEQSKDIAQGVDRALEVREAHMSEEEINRIGAGDQGMMIGYASNETEEYLPLPIALAHRLSRGLASLRKEKILPYLRPDGKTQVTVEYQGDKPIRVETVVVSTQHHPAVDQAEIEADLVERLILPTIPEYLRERKPRILVNPTGRFVQGGPLADTGLTGRKIIVDTYGGVVPHGGGCFSGKDPTKVDRSAAYMTRYAAKNLVAAGLAEKCQIQVAYAIGVAHPVSLMVHTYGTGKLPDETLTRLVSEVFDFRPAAIIRDLDLRKPQYRRLAAYGHMGRVDLNPLPAWERLDRVEQLSAAAKTA
ncbi:MAG TPA: methionine adenosyltransferase [Synergistales bacterium]|nr:methionine adenosyltransferase [Synergistales bacterium]